MNALTGTISVQNLHKKFGSNLVLQGISLNIQAGEKFASLALLDQAKAHS